MDERVGTKMRHVLFGDVLIKEIREIEGYTIAYFDGTFCNIDILNPINEVVSGE